MWQQLSHPAPHTSKTFRGECGSSSSAKAAYIQVEQLPCYQRNVVASMHRMLQEKCKLMLLTFITKQFLNRILLGATSYSVTSTTSPDQLVTPQLWPSCRKPANLLVDVAGELSAWIIPLSMQLLLGIISNGTPVELLKKTGPTRNSNTLSNQSN